MIVTLKGTHNYSNLKSFLPFTYLNLPRVVSEGQLIVKTFFPSRQEVEIDDI